MISYNNIKTVARYEAKTLRRSWLFRLFSFGALFILGIFNLGMFSPVGDQDWEALAIPASLPHLNLYMLNIAQALIIVFLASDFLKKDKKLDTNEVLYTRPMSNFEYIMGKTFGILRLFIGLNLFILLLCLVANITAKNTAIDISSYFTHLLIISLPTLIFSLGFAYILMSVIRNQAITFLLLLGFAALNMFYLWFRAGSIFDYMLFGMPVFKSEIVGYDNLSLIIYQRLLYTSLGVAFIMISILVFKRLPQSKSHAVLSSVILVISVAAAGFSGFKFYNNYSSGIEMKKNTLEANSRYEDNSFVTVIKADIEFEHRGKNIYATAGMVCKNNSGKQIEEILFSLNPGLTVKEVAINGNNTDFETDRHIIIIKPPVALAPGDECNIRISYDGGINEDYCYPYHNGNPKDDSYMVVMVNVNHRQAFVTEDYLLLTPETTWYPVASLNFYPSNPARIKVDFTQYSLRVKCKEDLVAVSQGNSTREGDSYLFSNSDPLTGLSLAIGNYVSENVTIDSVNYSAWYFPGHDYYRNDLSQLGDTLNLLVSGIMDELSNNFSTDYPFDRLMLVEVPVQFSSYDKKNTQTRSEVQPSMILLPEKLVTINDAGFYRTIKNQKRRMERNNQVATDKELQVRAFNSFVRNTFITSSGFSFNNGRAVAEPGRYLLGPSFYFFKNNFYSNDYPVINAVFESHLQKVESMNRNMARGFLGGLSENDRANTILRETSLEELLAENPSNDTLRIVLSVKGDYLFNLFRQRAGIKEFNDWFTGYLEANRFRNVEIEEFGRALNDKFGFSLEGIIEPWFTDDLQPGFYFTDVEAREIVINNRTRYKISFVASNPEPAGGLFNVTIRSGGPGPGGRGGGGQISISVSPGGRGNITAGGMGGRGMQTDEIDRIVWLGAGEAKRISIIKDGQPRAMSVNTIFSLNNPGELMFPFDEIIKERYTDATEGEELLPAIPPFTEDNEIIVDNEDPGFRVYEQTSSSRLKEWLNISRENRNDYNEMFSWWAPEYWQKTIQGGFYGMFIKSASYTRSGTGERYVSWTTPITSPGYYDIYTYIGKMGGNRMMGFGRNRDENVNTEYHYMISHDDGEEEVTLEYDAAENGWNHLGSYYLSPDSATVSLSNLSQGRTVTADAIKWVKQNNTR